MKKSSIILSLLFLALMFSCNSVEQDSLASEVMYEMSETPAGYSKEDMNIENEAEPVSTEEIEITDRKLIKTGDIVFETENLEATQLRIVKAVKKYNGYISVNNESKQYGSINYNIKIRIPSKNFDKLINDISIGVEEFDQKNIYVSDVTEEFLDVEARIKTKKELEARYIEILSKAYSVSDILNIERQIGELRTEIERFEGRLKYLKSQVAYSTIDINFYKTVSTDTKFDREFSNGMSSGWDNLIWFFVLLTYVWPFLIIALVVVFFIIRYERRKKNKLNNI